MSIRTVKYHYYKIDLNEYLVQTVVDRSVAIYYLTVDRDRDRDQLVISESRYGKAASIWFKRSPLREACKLQSLASP